ncbi:thioredoxin family protein [Aequorivita echinoideorum]|uniref:Thioredoxin family protein n=1 Tax=Aequorivita echinoideorum TaxID=1549647 RepID=A0ABS5S2G9_9FLAO|nr:thioredoxin family protein [Aequorivita echinoideorum]MBT0607403.1 thioredoxin family protein [Aequorivita echinoideorum]
MKATFFLILSLFLFKNAAISQNWETDFEIAKKTATEQNKPIILVFQGSDWCAPCIKLDREIWSTAEFDTYSKEHYVMLQADFPRKSKNKFSEAQQQQNNALAEKYNTQGYFPFVVILDKNGNVLGETGYEKTTVSNYIEKLNSFIK